MIIRVFVLIAVLGLFAPLPTNAKEIDASTPVICATIDVNDCAPGAQCIAGVPEDVSVPRFFRVDFAQKSIVVTRDDGTTLTTKNSYGIRNTGNWNRGSSDTACLYGRGGAKGPRIDSGRRQS